MVTQEARDEFLTKPQLDKVLELCKGNLDGLVVERLGCLGWIAVKRHDLMGRTILDRAGKEVK